MLSQDPADDQLKGTFVYNIWEAGQNGARFFNGDSFVTFMRAVPDTMTELMESRDGGIKRVVAHSGFLRAALAVGSLAKAGFEQDGCSLNILDMDASPNGRIVRKHLRLVNVTPRSIPPRRICA